MDNRVLAALVATMMVAIAVGTSAVAVVTEHGSDIFVIHPLGNPDYRFDEDVGVGTVYTYTVTGINYLYLDGSLYDVREVSGIDTVTVTQADEYSYTYTEKIVLTVGKIHETIVYPDNVVYRSGAALTSEFGGGLPSILTPSEEIGNRWGAHSLEVNNSTTVRDGTTHISCYFNGKDDHVCYQFNEQYTEESRNANSNVVHSNYELTFVLNSMNFVKL